MSLLLLFGEMRDNIIVAVCVSRQQKCGRLAGGVMVLVAGASHILAASTHHPSPALSTLCVQCTACTEDTQHAALLYCIMQ